MSRLPALSLEDSSPPICGCIRFRDDLDGQDSWLNFLEGFLRQGSNALNLGLSKIHEGAVLTAEPHQKGVEF